jgi:hypothetical protein
MRIKFYIYVIPEFRVPWLDTYKYPLPDTCTRWGGGCLLKYFNQVTLRILRPSVVHYNVRLMILCILFLMECTCPSQNLISDVLLCFLIPFSLIVTKYALDLKDI